MNSTVDIPSSATAELNSHLEQQAQSIAPQIALVPAQIPVERVSLTRNASSTPYIVYRVGERRCCTFFKRNVLWQLMQALLRTEYDIEDKIRSITSTPDFGLSFFVGSSWRHILNQQICRFIERVNNFSYPEAAMSSAVNSSTIMPRKREATITDPVQILVAAMRLAIACSNWNLVKHEIAAHSEYKTVAWSQLTRDEKQQLTALVPEAVKLLVEAKRNGAITSFSYANAQYCEASEDGLYWVRVKYDSPLALVTSCGVGSFVKEIVVLGKPQPSTDRGAMAFSDESKAA